MALHSLSTFIQWNQETRRKHRELVRNLRELTRRTCRLVLLLNNNLKKGQEIAEQADRWRRTRVRVVQ